MVKRAVLRGYGAQVQAGIAQGTRNRILAMISGMIVTMFLQSSAAVALLSSTFVGRGLMTVTAGLAVMIGADIGTAIVAQILSFKMTWVAPLLLSGGIILHLSCDSKPGKPRYLARIIIGIGFMLMALGIIREAAIPIADSNILPLILAPLENEPVLALLIAATLTYLIHSSLSAILLFATLAAGNVLSLDLALIFMVGANFGGGLIPLFAVMKDTPEAVQIPLGNIIMRLVMGCVFMFVIGDVVQFLEQTPYTTIQKVIFSHIGFNIAIAVLFLPLITPLAKLCQYLSPATESEKELQMKPRYLDKKALSSPSVAISCATRETLHMAEVLERMLAESYRALETHDAKLIKKVRAEDDILDDLFIAIKKYTIRLSREELNERESEQSLHVINFATNLEHCGDIIDKSLMEIAEKKAKNHFSAEGLKEIKSFHKKVTKNLKLAQSIFLSSDPILAKQLLDYKKGLKIAETKTSKNHMDRLRQGLPDTIATSSMHMDVIRDLRRINTYVSSVAYAILESIEHAK